MTSCVGFKCGGCLGFQRTFQQVGTRLCGSTEVACGQPQPSGSTEDDTVPLALC